MKKATITFLLAAVPLLSQAGDWGKAPIDKGPVEECVDLGGQISAGYETDYIFHGVRFARDSVWTDVNYTFEGLAIPVTIGAWYLNGINGNINGATIDELRAYAAADLGTIAGFDVSLGYTHFTFPEFRSAFLPVGGYGEVGLKLARSLGWIDLTLESSYAMGGGAISPSGWYHQAGLEKTIQLCDAADLVLGAGVAYSDGYWGPSGWNHYYATVSLPITLNCRTTLTPYIGYTGAPDTWVVDGFAGADQAQSDILHGGVSLSVSF